jgi:multisubunit Na+/H+ antiporter MnhB subunit
MKAMLIAIGLIFILGGIKAVNDPRPTLITMGGTTVRPGYTPPMSSVEAGPSQYMGYASIGLGVVTVVFGMLSKTAGRKKQNPRG